MKNLLAIFAVLVLTGILFSCHPEPAEGNPLTMKDDILYSSSSVSSSSLRLSSSYVSSSSSLRSSSSLISSSSYVSSSSLLLSSSSTLFCVIGVNCLIIGIDVEKEYCWQHGEQVTSCPRSSSSLSSSSSSSSACVNPPPYSSFSTITIGEQTWMAKNLNYAACSSICYALDESSCDTYGRLYDWATAMMVCPKGWHLPSQEEWDILSDFVGGSSTAGKHLKTTSGWYGNGNGLDTYEFAALPGGYGGPVIGWALAGHGGYWWSSNEGDDDKANRMYMGYDRDNTRWVYSDKYYLFSVRCVKDASH
jgi:uncharacterized protein (TIGR02145 family)